jgi:hypothetical protein
LKSHFFCAVYGGKIPDSIQELKIKGSNHTKGETLGIKLKNMKFNNNHMANRQLLDNFENGLKNVDKHLILAKVLAQETKGLLSS